MIGHAPNCSKYRKAFASDGRRHGENAAAVDTWERVQLKSEG